MSVTLWLIIALLILGLGLATAKAPRLTSALWWSTTATIFGISALAFLLPGPLRERLLWLALTTPLFWVALQFWCYWDERPWRVVSGLLVITFGGAAITAALAPIA